jgi:hypothetical protein
VQCSPAACWSEPVPYRLEGVLPPSTARFVSYCWRLIRGLSPAARALSRETKGAPSASSTVIICPTRRRWCIEIGYRMLAPSRWVVTRCALILLRH